MKILHITSPHTWRGGEQQLIYLAEELRNLGIEQVIMCPFNSPVHKYCLRHHLQHVTYFKGFSANPMVAFKVNHVCRREGITIVHAHDSHAHSFAVLSASIAGNPLPIVVSRRVDFAIQGSAMSRYKYNHPNVKKIICVSHAIQKVMEPFIEDHTLLTVVHSGIDLARFEELEQSKVLRTEFAIDDDHKLIGNVAALAPHKDYPTFVRTAKVLIEKGLKAKFIAIGEGPERKKIEQFIEKEGMEDHVILAGFRNDIAHLLTELDVFLITSSTEGLGTSVIDALAAGTPVVATRAGGIVEIIEHRVHGLLCNTGDEKMLAEGVMEVLNEDVATAGMVKAGKERAKQFSKSAMAAGTLKVYQELINGFL